jgi:hypothetical protein
MKPAHPVSHKPSTNSHVDSSIPSYGGRVVASHKSNSSSPDTTNLYYKSLVNSNRNNTNNYVENGSNSSKTNGFTNICGISGGDGCESSGAVPKRSGTCLASERKPNKIRPKLKAEAKVKTWCEDEDTVPMDWPSSKVKAVEPAITPPVLSQSWLPKKSEGKVRTELNM